LFFKRAPNRQSVDGESAKTREEGRYFEQGTRRGDKSRGGFSNALGKGLKNENEGGSVVTSNGKKRKFNAENCWD